MEYNENTAKHPIAESIGTYRTQVVLSKKPT